MPNLKSIYKLLDVANSELKKIPGDSLDMIAARQHVSVARDILRNTSKLPSASARQSGPAVPGNTEGK